MNGIDELRVAVVGLGYVGLPLAVAFGAIRPVVGYDVDSERVCQLRTGVDRTNETTPEELRAATRLKMTDEPSDLATANCYIVAVPTPVDKHKRPDLGPLLSASHLVGQLLGPGDLVIYESTVFPGATEEDCVPVLERASGLKFNHDFFVGYSPERVNPGDKLHRLATIKKVTSASTPDAAALVDALYRQVVTAGTHRAPSIRVAEAAKVIENTQRDINIALINELAIIFDKLNIDTEEVLKAARTKWNFLPFLPGLVGGHCIGVDPYYLTYKAQEVGYQPQVILAGRRLNDGMGVHVATQLVKAMLRRRMHVQGSNVLIMGLSFKENCPDIRNTRVVDIIWELESYGCVVDVYDPWISPDEAMAEYGIRALSDPQPGSYDATVVAVAHDQFRQLGAMGIRAFGRPQHVLYDIKYVLATNESDLRL